MPKLNDRDRLADLEARQTKIAQEIVDARRALRGKYATIIGEMEVEKLSERDFRDLLQHAIRVGGPASITALKGHAPASKSLQDKRP
ncbi:hypothetical protein [Sphingobium yanoikuyae]|uniref:hypothetical protein n=1 Tax=Sphingobium yanoikuyae TaxID=13690 RepID=UPI00241DE4BF|nr:hypothetical protein [Sphingobium yanoikuyae]